MSHPAPERISVSEFARRAGCDRKIVQRALEKGAISKGDDGLLNAAQIDGAWRKTNRRTILGSPATTAATKRGATQGRNVADETPAQAAERIVAGHAKLSHADAITLKENYLALRQQLEYDQKAALVHDSATCAAIMAEAAARVRTRLLALPSSRAPEVFRCRSVPEVEDVLRSAVIEALEELSDVEDTTRH